MSKAVSKVVHFKELLAYFCHTSWSSFQQETCNALSSNLPAMDRADTER